VAPTPATRRLCGHATTKSAWNDVIVKAARTITSPAASPRSAASSGPRRRGPGTCTARDLPRSRPVARGAPLRASTPTTRRSSGRGWPSRRNAVRDCSAIPHNSNGSKGLMFAATDRAGKPLTAEYARLRSHFERLIEMMQIKGTRSDPKFLARRRVRELRRTPRACRRSAAARIGRTTSSAGPVVKGLDYQSKLGANPFQYGFTGGTDNHNGLPSTSPRTTTSAATAVPTRRWKCVAAARSTAGSRAPTRIPAPSPACGRRRIRAARSGMR